MGVNSLLKTVTRQRRDCDLNPGPSSTGSSTLTTRLPSHPHLKYYIRGLLCLRHPSSVMLKALCFCVVRPFVRAFGGAILRQDRERKCAENYNK